MKKIKIEIFLLFFLIIAFLPAAGQDENVLVLEYDKAFYAQKYTVALPLIETLMALAPENLAYRREQIKMLALLDQEKEFLEAFRVLRMAEADNHFDHLGGVIRFELLPEKYLDLIRVEAQKTNDHALLKSFFPQLKIAQSQQMTGKSDLSDYSQAKPIPEAPTANP